MASPITRTEATRVSQIDRHLAGGDYHGWAGEPFDFRDKSRLARIARTVLFRRVRSVLVRAHGDGLIAHTLNFDYEVRSAQEAFGELPDAKTDDEMLDLALHIINKKAGRFDPTKFDDRYDLALVELVKAKMEGRKITPPKAPEPTRPSDLIADGGFERVQIGDAQLPVQNIDLFRLEPWNGDMSSTPSGTSRRSFSSKGWVPVLCNLVTMSAIVPPIPGSWHSRFSAITRSSGSTGTESVSAARW